MVPNRWLVNASPLILLGKVEQIQLLGALAGDIKVRCAYSPDACDRIGDLHGQAQRLSSHPAVTDCH